MNPSITSNKRNGLESDFFNFVPVVYGATALVGARKIKTKKYENRETDSLAINYPHKLTSEEQNKMLQTLVKQQEKLIEMRDKAKGKQRAMVVGRLRAFDEYLLDVRNVRDELAQQEKQAMEQLAEKEKEAKQTPSVEDKIKSDVVLSDVTKTPSENIEQPATKSNTLLYVGIGVALLVILLMRKK